MASTQELIDEVESLPVDDRIRVVDRLLQSLNRPDPEIEKKWVQVAKRRDEELRTGKVKGIPLDDALDEIERTCDE